MITNARAGITKLSELTIDADKNWQAKGISNIKELAAAMAQGEIVYRGAAGMEKLAVGTVGHFLQTQGAGANPVWAVGGVLKSTFDANTILKADADDTPVALTIGEQTLLGRITAGVIAALTPAQVRTLLSIVSLPNTIANVLSDHNLAAHTALGLFDESSDVDHNATTNYAANQHVALPATIAAVLSDHDKAAHDALGLDHGALSGKDDDDHTQYLLINGTRAMTGDLDMGAHNIYFKASGKRLYWEFDVTRYLYIEGVDNGAGKHGTLSFRSYNGTAWYGAGDRYPHMYFEKGYVDLGEMDLKVGTIQEEQTDAGVIVDNCHIKDGKAADADKVDGKHASDLQFAQNEEISLGSIPLSIYTLKSITGTTHTTLRAIDDTNSLSFKIVDRPTAPSGFTLKGRLCAFLRSNSASYTAYIELWFGPSTQVVEISTNVTVHSLLRSSLFTFPAATRMLEVRIWSSDASGVTSCQGAWIEFIAVKD